MSVSAGWSSTCRVCGRVVVAVAITSPRQKSDDAVRTELLDRVRPPDWTNPKPKPVYDLVIVGAGPAGLAAADLAIAAGRSVALLERNRLGGGSLNNGTIPSKAIVAAARLFTRMRDGSNSLHLSHPSGR